MCMVTHRCLADGRVPQATGCFFVVPPPERLDLIISNWRARVRNTSVWHQIRNVQKKQNKRSVVLMLALNVLLVHRNYRSLICFGISFFPVIHQRHEQGHYIFWLKVLFGLQVFLLFARVWMCMELWTM